MKTLFRIAMCLLAVVLLVPGQASAKKKSWSFGDRTLKQGHKGKDVKTLQRYLTRVGIEMSADGVFGRGTKAGVRLFEEAQRRKVDGKVTRTDAKVIKDVAVNGGAVASASVTGGALPKNVKMVVAEARAAAAARARPGHGGDRRPRRSRRRPRSRAAGRSRRSSRPATRSPRRRTSTAAATASGRTRATTAPARSPTRCTAAACSRPRCRPAAS